MRDATGKRVEMRKTARWKTSRCFFDRVRGHFPLFSLHVFGLIRYTIVMFLNPDDTIKHLFIHEDWHIADLGAGSGAYTLAVAQRAPMGKVYAIDINREILPFIRGKVLAHGHKNIEAVWGDIDRPHGTNMGDASMDAVILANTFFQIENKNSALQEIARILKPGGKILLVDWTGSFGNVGPREEDIVSPNAAKEMFEKFGFIFQKDVPAGEYHYGMIFHKKQ